MCVIRCSAGLNSDRDWFVWLHRASSQKRPPRDAQSKPHTNSCQGDVCVRYVQQRADSLSMIPFAVNDSTPVSKETGACLQGTSSALIPIGAVTRAVFLAPRGHEAKDGAKAFAMFGEGILDAGRHFGVDLAADDVVALELTKLLGQHFLRRPGEKPLQLAETADAPLQVEQDGGFPFAPNDVRGESYGAILRIHSVPLLYPGTNKVPTGTKETLA